MSSDPKPGHAPANHWPKILFDRGELTDIDKVAATIQRQFPDASAGACRKWAELIAPSKYMNSNPHHHGREDLEKLKQFNTHLVAAKGLLRALSRPTANDLVGGLRESTRDSEVTDLLYSLDVLIRNSAAIIDELAKSLAPPGERRKGGRVIWRALYVTEKVLDCWDDLSGKPASRKSMGVFTAREAFLADILQDLQIGMDARSAFHSLVRERPTLFSDL